MKKPSRLHLLLSHCRRRRRLGRHRTGRRTTAMPLPTFDLTITPNYLSPPTTPRATTRRSGSIRSRRRRPYRSPDSQQQITRYLLLDPRYTDSDGRKGHDEWWFVIERNWPSSYPASNHGRWGRQVNFHNVAGDAGPGGGIGWGFGTGVSSLALDWLNGKAAPAVQVETCRATAARTIPVARAAARHVAHVRRALGRRTHRRHHRSPRARSRSGPTAGQPVINRRTSTPFSARRARTASGTPSAGSALGGRLHEGLAVSRRTGSSSRAWARRWPRLADRPTALPASTTRAAARTRARRRPSRSPRGRPVRPGSRRAWRWHASAASAASASAAASAASAASARLRRLRRLRRRLRLGRRGLPARRATRSVAGGWAARSPQSDRRGADGTMLADRTKAPPRCLPVCSSPSRPPPPPPPPPPSASLRPSAASAALRRRPRRDVHEHGEPRRHGHPWDALDGRRQPERRQGRVMGRWNEARRPDEGAVQRRT